MATVQSSTYVTPGMIRIVFGGPELSTFETSGVGDEYLRLYFPTSTGEIVMPTFKADGSWERVEHEVSVDQCYTVRHFDPATGEVTIDIVVHEGGVASTWALNAKPGDAVGMGLPRGLYDPPADAAWQILAADATGLPAIGRLLEQMAPGTPVHVITEIAHPSHEQQIATAADARFTWLHGMGNGVAASALEEALRSVPWPDGRGYVWVAGETKALRGVRRYLRHERGMAADTYKVIGYWTDRAEEWERGWENLDATIKQQIDAAWSSGRDPELVQDEVDATLDRVGL